MLLCEDLKLFISLRLVTIWLTFMEYFIYVLTGQISLPYAELLLNNSLFQN